MTSSCEQHEKSFQAGVIMHYADTYIVTMKTYQMPSMQMSAFLSWIINSSIWHLESKINLLAEFLRKHSDS